jgi:serine/threonine-protein kinase
LAQPSTFQRSRRWLFPLAAVAIITSACSSTQATGWTSGKQDGQIVYAGLSTGRVVAAQASDGQQKWEYPAESDKNITGIYSYPVASQGTVYVGASDKHVYALDAETGTKKWDFLTGAAVPGSALVANGTVYIGSSDDYLYALDAATGAKKWAFQANDSVWGTPILSDGILYITSLDHNLYALSEKDGSKLWQFTTGGALPGSPVLGKSLYIGSLDGSLYAVDPKTGTLQWSFKSESWIWSGPLVTPDALYVGSFDRNLYALDPATGAKIQSFADGGQYTSDGRINSNPVLAAGLIVFATDGGKIYAVDPAGKLASGWPLDAGGPVIASLTANDTMVYASDNNSHRLFAIDVSSHQQRWELAVKK